MCSVLAWAGGRAGILTDSRQLCQPIREKLRLCQPKTGCVWDHATSWTTESDNFKKVCSFILYLFVESTWSWSAGAGVCRSALLTRSWSPSRPRCCTAAASAAAPGYWQSWGLQEVRKTIQRFVEGFVVPSADQGTWAQSRRVRWRWAKHHS